MRGKNKSSDIIGENTETMPKHIYKEKANIVELKRTHLLQLGGETHMFGRNTINRRLKQWPLRGVGRKIN